MVPWAPLHYITRWFLTILNILLKIEPQDRNNSAGFLLGVFDGVFPQFLQLEYANR